MKLKTELHDQLADLVAGEGLELLAIETAGGGSRTTLRLVIDGPDGVSLDHCASVSRQASVLLDVEDPFSHAYTLEVSSPGLDRKLYGPQDYARFAGHRVKFRMEPSYREQRLVVGELAGFEDDTVEVRLDSQEVVRLPLEKIHEARLEVDWSSVFDGGKRRP
jgi:ribosome maturation factor RimP